LEPGEDIPKHPFPHAPARPHKNSLREVKSELQEVKPPLVHIDSTYYEATPFKAQDHRESLREKHLAVLVTVLHRMLLKGDYHRAGRAWGLLLRSGYLVRDVKQRVGHFSMDVRSHDRWGIGAEILMRGGTRNLHTNGSGEVTDEFDSLQEEVDFSEPGFRAAREYYERLIVQYPEHHKRKGAKASIFYAAMFSLWIYEIHAKSRQAQSRVENGEGEIPAYPEHKGSESPINPESRESLIRAVKEAEYEDAKDIASRLGELVVTPPYDKNPELLQLSGMVALWIGDLQEGNTRDKAMEQAKSFFLRSRANGGNIWEGVEHVITGDEW
jgi:hypothetical protein